MTLKEYCRNIDTKVISFEGNNISRQCQNFVEGLLEKSIMKRFAFNQAMHHPWILGIKSKVDDIIGKFQNDPDKMVIELNKARVDDEYFKSFITDSIFVSDDNLRKDNICLNKKRSRNAEN
jgi:hypothetical protein